MEAGRELDILVAEKVMDWRADTCGGYNTPTGYRLPEEAPAYSTDIADAMELVAKLSNRAWLCLKSPFEPGEPWFAFFEDHGWVDTRPLWRGEGATAAEAITRAAIAYAENVQKLRDEEEEMSR